MICDIAGAAAGPGSDQVDAAVTPPDDVAMTVLNDAYACFGTGLVNVCLTALPTGAVRLPGSLATIDTGVDASCTQVVTQPSGVQLCVIAGTSVTVSGGFTAIGARPLVVLGLDTVTVDNGGTIDVSSRLAGGRVGAGAGANTGPCTTIAPAEADGGGGGGGGGGGFGTPGGRGGLGDHNDNNNQGGTAAGGAAGAVQPVTSLRGGCRGGNGGDSDTAHGGVAGEGGGGVYVIAGRTITIAGSVFASGAGGGVNPDPTGIEQGGGGGGAGGMIGLDAPAVDVTGRVAANGGAGGGGGGNNRGGTPGADGSTLQWNQRAPGGLPAEVGAGQGASGTSVGQIDQIDPADADGGGGGAAGGLGVVRIDGALTGGAMISPAPTR